MAGAGYKLFNTGDVLTAAQVNTYLNEQTVMVFANSTARTTALSGVLAEGMVSYLQDTNAVEVYNGSAWVGVSGAGDVTEVQAGTGISVASGTGPIPVVTNTMATAVDAKGDLIVGTGADTFARLAVGTNGHTLVADSVETTGLKWAAPSSGALTKIASASYSAVASVTVDSVFSSTYKAYLVIIENSSGTDGAELALQFRYGSSTEGGANYNNGGFRVKSNQTTVNYGVGSATAFKLIDQSLNPCALNLYFTSVGNTSEAGRFWGTAIVENTQSIAMMGGRVAVNETYTGFVLSVSTGTTTGRYAVYGLAN